VDIFVDRQVDATRNLLIIKPLYLPDIQLAELAIARVSAFTQLRDECSAAR
jgi:hypothetical protein